MAKTIVGFEQVTKLQSVQGFDSALAAASHYALVHVESQPVRFRQDGTAPTTAIGEVLLPGFTYLIEADLTQAKFLETAASAKLNVHFLADKRFYRP